MNQLCVLNEYSLPEQQTMLSEIVNAISDLVDEGKIPTYRKLAGKLGYKLLVVTKLIEMHPDLTGIMNLARTAAVSEVEEKLMDFAMGQDLIELKDEDGNVYDVKPGMFAHQVGAAKTLLEANNPNYGKKSINVKIENPTVPVGQAGQQQALSAMDEIQAHWSKMS